MSLITRVWRADELRRTRFHTVTGRLCLDPSQMIRALSSTILRHATGRLLDLPWLTFPAINYLKNLPCGLTVFEYGCGMSTAWYGRRFREVYGVDANPEWFDRVKDAISDLSNVHISLERESERYIANIHRVPCEYFDLIIIDGEHRLECLRHGLFKLKQGGIVIADNTDVHPELIEEMQSRPVKEAHVFPGYGPGALHPWETRAWVI